MKGYVCTSVIEIDGQEYPCERRPGHTIDADGQGFHYNADAPPREPGDEFGRYWSDSEAVRDGGAT